MELEKARADFIRLQDRVSAIDHAVSLIFYDGETTAPSNTADNRIRALEVLNATIYNLKYGDETAELLDFLSEHKDELSLIERRSFEILKRDVDKRRNVPRDKFVAFENLLTSAQDAWHRAIEDQNYGLYRPYLEQVFERTCELASYGNSGMSPYDYCLDGYEPGTKTAFYDILMEGIRTEITPLFHKIMERPPLDDSCLKGDFSAEKQAELAEYLMERLGIDTDHVGLSTAEHPFSRTMGSHFDVRVATKYSRKDFTQSLYTMLYECGHVLYVTGRDDEVAYTFVDDPSSLGIMESQTYFYENVVGRSRAFIEAIYPKLKELFPDPIANHTPEDIYLAVNKVSAGPIRIGSDEISNNLHLLLRYELEKALMDKSLSVRDLPDAWVQKYKDYLGIEVTDPVQGVLQDIHWAHGAIGYFPTVALGKCYSGIFLEKIKEDVDIASSIREGSIASINQWNRNHVWTKAGIYDTKDVIDDIAKGSVNSDAYVKYLKGKYSELYNI